MFLTSYPGHKQANLHWHHWLKVLHSAISRFLKSNWGGWKQVGECCEGNLRAHLAQEGNRGHISICRLTCGTSIKRTSRHEWVALGRPFVVYIHCPRSTWSVQRAINKDNRWLRVVETELPMYGDAFWQIQLIITSLWYCYSKWECYNYLLIGLYLRCKTR